MYNHIKYLVFIFLIASVLSSCGNGNRNSDKYYTDHGDWDDVRFPLIKPYEALCLDGIHDWIVQPIQSDTVAVLTMPGTRKINIVNRMILIYSTKTLLNGADAKEAWFVLIPDKWIEKGFALHREYLDYLHSLGFTNEPQLYDMDQISEEFSSRDTIDWKRLNMVQTD